MGKDPMTFVFIAALIALVAPSFLSLLKYFRAFRRAAPADHRLVVRVADKELSFDAKAFSNADVRRFEKAAETIQQLQTIR